MTRWVFAIAVLLSAFLLFLVQPLIGRFVLPWFGGGQMVWTGCLLFFQVALLAGYAYSHFAARVLGRSLASRLHLGLLLLCLPFLPLIPADSLRPSDPERPLAGILWVLTAAVGVPYFVLSTTGPLLQSWFSYLFPGRSPYRLFALSNLGSLLGLFAYPFLVEPWLTRHQQAWAWSGGFVLFAAACGWCAWRASGAPLPAANPNDDDRASEPDDELARAMHEQAEDQAREVSANDPTQDGRLGYRPLLWLALACVPSILLVATTSQMCQEIAVVPFLWTLPLGLYLLSFVICFDRPRWYLREFWILGLAVSLMGGEAVLWAGLRMPIPFQLALLSAALFFACMTCHGELARSKPAPQHLTLYYLCLSLGGAAGGLFVGLLAPHWFPDFWELPIGYLLAPLVVGIATALDTKWWARWGMRIALPVGLPVWAFVLWIHMCGAAPEFENRVRSMRSWQTLARIGPRLLEVRSEGVIYQGRDSYGLLKVREMTEERGTGEDRHDVVVGRKLINGRIEHGFQLDDRSKLLEPASYYGPESGLGIAVRALRMASVREPEFRGQGLRIGVVGLGAGAISAWGKLGDAIVFYELSPHVERVCREHFDFLEQSPASTEVRLGDARVVLEREVAAGDLETYDVLAIDAFSSDAIPLHLLTREAFELYEKRLRPGGVLAVHVSNRFLDLSPIVRNLAMDLGAKSIRVVVPDTVGYQVPSEWILVTRNERFVSDELIENASAAWSDEPRNNVRWTDDFSSLWQVLRKAQTEQAN